MRSKAPYTPSTPFCLASESTIGAMRSDSERLSSSISFHQSLRISSPTGSGGGIRASTPPAISIAGPARPT